MRMEIRIAGFGGQGVGLAGHIIGKAIAIYTDREAVMTQSYGPEARGGASCADIVLSDNTIDYPFIQKPDILVLFSQEAYSKFRSTSKKSAAVLIDSGLVIPLQNDLTFNIPATAIAEELGHRIVANMIMLGYLSSITNVVQPEPLVKAIKTTVKPKFIELNLKAFHSGYEYATEKISI